MICEECDADMPMGNNEYLERKDNLGVVLCYDCRHGVAPTAPHA